MGKKKSHKKSKSVSDSKGKQDIVEPKVGVFYDSKGRGPTDPASATEPFSEADNTNPPKAVAKQKGKDDPKGKGLADPFVEPEEAEDLYEGDGETTEAFSEGGEEDEKIDPKDLAKIKKEVKKLRDQVKKQRWNVMSLVGRHHQKIQETWSGMPKKQREKILKGAYKSSNPGSGVDIPTEQSPDVEMILDIQDAKRLGKASGVDTKKFWYWFMVPQINLPGLVRDRNLLVLLFHRAIYPLYEFAEGDFVRTWVGWYNGAYDKELPTMLKQGVIIRRMTLQTWFEFYGRFLDQNTMTEKELEELGAPDMERLFGMTEDPEHGVWILDAQSFLYRFLFNSCKAILDAAKVPKAQLVADSEGPSGWEIAVEDEPPCFEEMPESDRLMLERPYRLPQTIDLNYIADVIEEAVKPWKEHMDRLKLDPGYFAKTMALSELTNVWGIRGNKPEFADDADHDQQIKSDLSVWAHIGASLIKADLYERILRTMNRVLKQNEMHTESWLQHRMLYARLNEILSDDAPITRVDQIVHRYVYRPVETCGDDELAEQFRQDIDKQWAEYAKQVPKEKRRYARGYFDALLDRLLGTVETAWEKFTEELVFLEEALEAAYFYQTSEFSWAMCEPQTRIFYRKVYPPDGVGRPTLIQKKGEWASDLLGDAQQKAALEVIGQLEELVEPPDIRIPPATYLGRVRRLAKLVEKHKSEGNFFPTPWFIAKLRDAEAILNCHCLIKTLESYARSNREFKTRWEVHLESEREDLMDFHGILERQLMWHLVGDQPYIKRATAVARLLRGAETGYSLADSGQPDTAEMKAGRQHYNDLLDHFWYCVHLAATGASTEEWEGAATFSDAFEPLDDVQVQFARDHARPELEVFVDNLIPGKWLRNNIPDRIRAGGPEDVADFIKLAKDSIAFELLLWNNDIPKQRRQMQADLELEIYGGLKNSIEKCRYFHDIEKQLDARFLVDIQAAREKEAAEKDQPAAPATPLRGQGSATGAGAGDLDDIYGATPAHPDIRTHDLEYTPQKRKLPEPPAKSPLKHDERRSPLKTSIISKRARDEGPSAFRIPRTEEMIELLEGRKLGKARVREQKAAEAAAEEAARAAQAAAQSEAAPLDHPPKRKFVVRKADYNVFRCMLSDEVARSQAPSLAWDDIVLAMRRMGCTKEQGQGSAVVFSWEHRDHENDTDPRIPRYAPDKYRPGRPREWHVPHGKKENAVSYANYRRLGKALMEQFDWTWDRFELLRAGKRQSTEGGELAEEEADDGAEVEPRPPQQEAEPGVHEPPPIVPIEDDDVFQVPENDLVIPELPRRGPRQEQAQQGEGRRRRHGRR